MLIQANGSMDYEDHAIVFEHSAGYPIDDIEDVYGAHLYIGGTYIDPSVKTRFLSVYARCGVGFYLKDIGKHKFITASTEIIGIPNDMLGDCKRYRVEAEIRRGAKIDKVYMMGDIHFAFHDTNDNLYFSDFMYYGRRYREAFKFVLDHAWEQINNEGLAVSRLEEALMVIDPKKVTKLVIETEFDKDAYVKQVTEKAATTMSLFRKSADSRVKVLTNRIDREREVYAKRMKEGELQSFISGISAMKNDHWVIKRGRLYYDKKIIAKYITKGDKTVKTGCEDLYVTGLNLAITPKPTAAAFTKACHSNVSSDTVCIGDLQGHPLNEVMEKLPKALETCGLNSPYSGEGTGKAIKILDTELKKDKKAKKKHTATSAWLVDNPKTKKQIDQMAGDTLMATATRAAGR